MSTTTFSKRPEVALIKGDGIGPEISNATVRILDAAGANIEWVEAFAGENAATTHGSPLPQETLDTIERTRVALKAPLATPVGSGFRSINVTLRQHFELFANVRPARTMEGVPANFDNVDVILVRENTEGFYMGIEHYIDREKSAAESIGVFTRKNSERICRYAMELAQAQGRKRVTIVHKANILKLTNGLFLEVGKQVGEEYPELEVDDMIVDATAMRLVVSPERFDVLVTMNLFGDILSDLCAGLIGGLGVAPAANFGKDGTAMFEAVHGTAPDIAGKGIANPTALALSACMLVEHVGQKDVAERARAAIKKTLADPESRTGDLKGKADTKSFAEAVVRNLG